MLTTRPPKLSIKRLNYRLDNPVLFLEGARDFFSLLQNVHTGFGAHPASCPMGTGCNGHWHFLSYGQTGQGKTS
jgi:hypothetical protein